MESKRDVLIIGAGPVGLSCAYYLLKAGRQVTLLDAKEIGKGSGAGNAGHIVPSHIIPLAAPGVVASALKWMLEPAFSPFGMKLSLDPRYLAWLVQFAAACNEANVQRGIPPLKYLGQLSAENFARLVAEEKIECHYRTAGFLNLYRTRQAFEAARREADFIQKQGIPVRMYEAAEVQAVEPAAREDVLGGIHFTGDAYLDPARFLAGLAERVRAMGAEIIENTPVTGFLSAQGKVRGVQAGAGEWEAEQVVLAAGAWSGILARKLGLHIPLQPARGYSLTASAVQHMPQHALILGDRRVAVTPLGTALRVTGRLEVGEFSVIPNPRWIERLEGFAREYLRLEEALEIRETWAGLRPTTPDGMPLIGFSPRHSNLILATGHAMLGLSLGPGTGQVVAELANGAKPAAELRALGYRYR